jgi:dUTP pyrophosphatase
MIKDRKKMQTYIEIKNSDKRFPTPSYATVGSAGLDLYACIPKPITLKPNRVITVGSGISININNPLLVGILASRSGLYKKHGIRIGQGIGVIDSDYQGEIGVMLHNDSSEDYVITPGDRIAQLMFVPVFQASLVEVDEFSVQTERADGGFGSTGTN